MDSDTTGILIAAALMAITAMIVATATGSGNLVVMLKDYQTLITGLLAVGAAVATVVWMQKQMRQTAELEEKRRIRDLNASRSVLPLALSNLTQYLEDVSSKLTDLIDLDVMSEGIIEVPSAFALPRMPDEEVPVFRDCIRSADPQPAEMLAELLRKLQVHRARIEDDVRPSEQVAVVALYGRLVDVVRMYALTDRLFPFSRGEQVDTSPVAFPDAEDAANRLKLFEYSDFMLVLKAGYDRKRRSDESIW